MAISEGMLDIVAAGINWITKKMGPSKKEMRVRIEDLEKELGRLSEGNRALSENVSLMTSAIIAQLKENTGYTINVDIDTITLTGVNNGVVQTENRRAVTKTNSTLIKDSNLTSVVASGDVDDNPFFVTDEDLARARIETKYK